MTRILHNTIRLLRSPRVAVAYAKWMSGRCPEIVAQTPEGAAGIKIGNFENFSHYWARRIPIAPETLDLFSHVWGKSPDGCAAIDVGSNIGITCLAMAHAGFERILALEPTPGTYERLQKNLQLNPGLTAKVTALQMAAGAESGRSAFQIRPGSSEQNGFVSDAKITGLSSLLQVDVVTIDQLVEEHGLVGIGLLKIDVEGFEYEVLRGARKSFEENLIRYVYVELIEEALSGAGTSTSEIEHFLAHFGLSPKVWIESDGFASVPLAKALQLSGEERSVLFGQ